MYELHHRLGLVGSNPKNGQTEGPQQHYGTFHLTDEPVGEPPQRFIAAAEAAGWTDDHAWVFRIGETRVF